MEKPGLSVGICAFNEERNIGNILQQVLCQEMESAHLLEVLVVSSGSTDKTDSIVEGMMEQDSRIILIRQNQRMGKASAVNMVSRNSRGELVALCGADLAINSHVLEKMVCKMSDGVGMVGARPVPVNEKGKLAGFCSHLVWELHHEIAKERAKCGELVLMRNRRYEIPKDIGADEAFLEHCFCNDGFRLAYAEDAIVRNRGPDTVNDYIKQRRRIHAQHMRLKKRTGHSVSTGSGLQIAKALASKACREPRSIPFVICTVALEALAVLLGAYDHYIKKDGHTRWSMVESTKEI